MIEMTKITPMLFVGAAAAAIAVAPTAYADPPPCVNPDGTPCAGAEVGPGGASVEIPYGPDAAAGPGGANVDIPYGPDAAAGPGGASVDIPYGPDAAAGPGGANVDIPYGPTGEAGPGGASGCAPYVGCVNIPAG